MKEGNYTITNQELGVYAGRSTSYDWYTRTDLTVTENDVMNLCSGVAFVAVPTLFRNERSSPFLFAVILGA